MKEIPLTQGKIALVDDEDFECVSKLKWCAVRGKYTFYAVGGDCSSGSRRHIYLHRFILGLTDPKIETDHRDGNGLNCTRLNLRLCTPAENARNRSRQGNNTSGYKGVSWEKVREKWRAEIQANGKRFMIGRFENLMDAVFARDKAARKLHGVFAVLNLTNDN